MCIIIIIMTTMLSTGQNLQSWIESDKETRWIKEAVHMQKEGQHSINWDEGSYTLSHMYDRFLAMSHHY